MPATPRLLKDASMFLCGIEWMWAHRALKTAISEFRLTPVVGTHTGTKRHGMADAADSSGGKYLVLPSSNNRAARPHKATTFLQAPRARGFSKNFKAMAPHRTPTPGVRSPPSAPCIWRHTIVSRDSRVTSGGHRDTGTGSQAPCADSDSVTTRCPTFTPA